MTRIVAKSQPTVSEVHVNVPLTNVAVAFAQDPANFVGPSMFPRVPVPFREGVYYTYDKNFFRRSGAKKRAVGANSARSGYGVATDTYTCDRDALEHAIPDPVRRNWNNPGDPDRLGMEFLAQQIMLAQELNIATKYFASSIWDNNGAQAAGAWELAASTPIEDIKTGQRTLLTNTGFEGNTLLLGKKCFDNLTDHPDIIDRIKAGAGPGNPALFNEQSLAQVLGVSRVLVGRASYVSTQEGVAATNAMVLGTRHALLVYAAPAPSLMAPSAGYTFTWAGAGNDMGFEATRYREDPVESDILGLGAWYQHKVVAASLGVFWSNAVAA